MSGRWGPLIPLSASTRGLARILARDDAPSGARDRAKHDVVRPNGYAVELAARRLPYRGNDGRCARDGRWLAHSLGAVWRVGVRMLDEIAYHWWHVEHRREQVVGERGVPHLTVAQLELLHDREAEALGDPAFELADHGHGVDGLPDVLRRRDLDDLHQAGLDVDINGRAVRREEEGHVSVVLRGRVARLGRTMAMLHEPLDGLVQQVGHLDVGETRSARRGAPLELGLHLVARRQHSATGHPRLP